MSLDGNGTYSPPAPQFPAIPNTVIYADDFNQIILDIATALSTAIFRDGQAAFTANQSMGRFQLKDLANGTAPQDATTVLQVFTDPHFKATTAEGVKVSGTAMTVSVSGKIDFSNSATVILPPETHGVTPDVADNTTKVATTKFVKSVAMNTALPGQTGNAGKWLQTDGTNANWADIFPIQTGQTGKFLQTDGTALSWAAVVPPNIKRSARTSNTMLVAGDNQKLIDITSGTFTQTFDAAATLGDGWFCYLRNSGSGDITLTPSGAETIDDLTSFIMYPGEVRLVQCDGTALRSIVLNSFYKVFEASGNFTKPPGYRLFEGLLWGGGGGGGPFMASLWSSSGGGGGACCPIVALSSALSTTTTVTIGSGGSAGSVGGTSSFGSYVSAYGGAPGTSTSGTGNSRGGGGGGVFSAGTGQVGGAPAPGATSASDNSGFGGANGDTASGGRSVYGGAAGGGSMAILTGYSGAASVFGGGGGGGGSGGVGGYSSFGGSGGNYLQNGVAPGGGGGGQASGARGELRIWGVI